VDELLRGLNRRTVRSVFNVRRGVTVDQPCLHRSPVSVAKVSLANAQAAEECAAGR
jgi:hypothetical protein